MWLFSTLSNQVRILTITNTLKARVSILFLLSRQKAVTIMRQKHEKIATKIYIFRYDNIETNCPHHKDKCATKLSCNQISCWTMWRFRQKDKLLNEDLLLPVTCYIFLVLFIKIYIYILFCRILVHSYNHCIRLLTKYSLLPFQPHPLRLYLMPIKLPSMYRRSCIDFCSPYAQGP